MQRLHMNRWIVIGLTMIALIVVEILFVFVVPTRSLLPVPKVLVLPICFLIAAVVWLGVRVKRKTPWLTFGGAMIAFWLVFVFLLLTPVELPFPTGSVLLVNILLVVLLEFLRRAQDSSERRGP